MKLQGRYTRTTILSTLFVLLIAAAGYYFLIHYILVREVDESLKVEEAEIHDFVRKHNKLPDASSYKDQVISFEKTDVAAPRKISNASVFDPEDQQNKLSRQLVFTIEAAGEEYVARVSKPEEGIQNLVWIIVLLTTGLMGVLLLLLFLANRFLFRNLWKPFGATLGSIRNFDIGKPSTISTGQSSIEEFNELNQAIQAMTQKVKNDYDSLKHFTDHASHEMQTPLAIMRSKLDVLIQQPELSETSMNHIQETYRAIDKLSRLSQSLLLLAKIENKQYGSPGVVHIHEMAEEKIRDLQEWLTAKQLVVEKELQPLTVSMNPQLAGILIANLLNNAIRHTAEGSTISITTAGKHLTVSNPGPAALDKERIFDRFARSENSEGAGLGLAIVKQIAGQYGLAVDYTFANSRHIFTVNFSPLG